MDTLKTYKSTAVAVFWITNPTSKIPFHACQTLAAIYL